MLIPRRPSAAFSRANFLSRWTFSFVAPLLRKGADHALQDSDLDDLCEDYKTTHVSNKLATAWTEQVRKKDNDGTFRPSFWKALYLTFRWYFWASGFWTFAESATRIGQPVVLGFLLAWFQEAKAYVDFNASTSISVNASSTNTTDTINTIANPALPSLFSGLLLAFGLILISILQIFIHHVLYYYTMLTGFLARQATRALIHKHLLLVDATLLANEGTGRITNLLSNDTYRFDYFFPRLHFLWSAPLDFIIVFIVLVFYVEWIAAIAGVGIIIISLPLQMYFGHLFALYRRKTVKFTDSRVSLTSQIFASIETIKSYVWETPLGDQVTQLRDMERACIFVSMKMKSFNYVMNFITPYAATLLTVLVFWLQGNDLQFDKIFPAMALIQVLKTSLGKNFANAIEQAPEAMISIRRIRNFLLVPQKKTYNTNTKVLDVQKSSSPSQEKNDSKSEAHSYAIELKDVAFRRIDATDVAARALNTTTLQLRPGTLCLVQGSTGSGKSTFLECLLSEHHLIKTPENEESTFNVNGNLGYAAQQPYIFADSIRSNIVWDQLFDQAWYDRVVQACTLDVDFALLADGDSTQIGANGVNLSGGQKARIALARVLYAKPDIYLLDDVLAAVDVHVGVRLFRNAICGLALKECKGTVVLVTHQTQYAPYADVVVTMHNIDGESQVHDSKEEKKESSNTLDVDEEANMTSIDTVSVSVPGDKATTVTKEKVMNLSSPSIRGPIAKVSYQNHTGDKIDKKDFFRNCESAPEIVMDNQDEEKRNRSITNQSDVEEDAKKPLVIVQKEERRIGTVTWAAYKDYTRAGGSVLALMIFASFVLSEVVVLADWWLNIWVSQDAANQRDPIFLYVYAGLTAAGFLFGAIRFALIYIRRYFVQSSRELKRLESITNSPLISSFTEHLRGIHVLRSFDSVPAYLQQQFENNLDENGRAWYSWLLVNRWVGFRLDTLASSLLIIVTLLAVILTYESAKSNTHGLDIGIVSLALTYTIQISGVFQYMIRLSAKVETMMTSVERVLHYCELPSELEVISGTNKKDSDEKMDTVTPIVDVDTSWPPNGTVEANNLQIRYRSDWPVVVKGVNFKFSSGMKIGICGRTGSGKSTLASSILRLNVICGGVLSIDDVNVTTIPLATLRNAVGYIPQTPYLFSGTLRFNLDPCNYHTDEELWDVLKPIETLYTQIKNDPNGLSMRVAEHGSNFSVGERQCISMARALLRSAPIYIMDEATANIDKVNDKLIQTMLRSHPRFLNATMFIIAHRMDTIEDCDQIMVLDDGKVVELGTPKELKTNEESIFSQMIKNHNEQEKQHKTPKLKKTNSEQSC
eukprot:g2856.t1